MDSIESDTKKDNGAPTRGPNEKRGGRNWKKSRELLVEDDSPAEVDEKGRLVRVSRPDTATNEVKVKALYAKIEVLNGKRSGIIKQLSESFENNKPFIEKRNELNASIDSEHSQQRMHLNDAAALKAQISEILNANDARRVKEKKARAQLSFDSVAQVEAKLKSLEHQHQTMSFSRAEEKELMRKIADLRTARRKVAEFEKSQNEARKSSKTEDLSTLRAMQKECYEKVETHKANETYLRKQISALNDQNKASAKRISELNEQRSAVQKELSAVSEELDAVRVAHQKEWVRYKKYQAALTELREKEQKERELKKKLEQEEYERRLEEEELARKPWESEIAQCDILTTYLLKLAGKKKAGDEEVQSPTASSTEKSASASGFEGMQVLSKKKADDPFMMMGAAKKKHQKKKKEKKIVHPLELLQSFALLELTAPNKVEEIPAAIEALKGKRDYFDVLPRPPRKPKGVPETDGAEVTESSDKKPEKKSSPKRVPASEVLTADSFPVLPGFREPANKVDVTDSCLPVNEVTN